MNGYELTRNWFNFAFDKKEAKSHHTALYCWTVELNNRLGWKKEFGIPTQDTMEGLSIGNKQTYLSALKDLQSWGFIKIIKESKNQYQACIISLRHNESDTALVSALDTALVSAQGVGIGVSTVPIDKPLNKETSKQINISFDEVWNLYEKKTGDKEKLIVKWGKLKDEEREAVMQHIPKYKIAKPDKQFRKDFQTYLNNKAWNDEIIGETKLEGKFNKYVNRVEGFFYPTKYMTEAEFANFENKGYYTLKERNVDKPANY